MKWLLTVMQILVGVTGSSAADLPPAAPPPLAPIVPPVTAPARYMPVVAPVYNWGGFYIGLNAGYGFGRSKWTAPSTSTCSGCTTTFSTDGALVGGTVGVNFQTGQFVFGPEADIDWAGLKGSITTTSTLCGGVSCRTSDDFLGTARGRIGFAADRFLAFATFGGAFGNIQSGLSTPGNYDSTTKLGWAAGAGIEVASTDNLSARIEYLYVDLGSATCATVNSNCGPVASGSAVTLTANLIRLGINYKFVP